MLNQKNIIFVEKTKDNKEAIEVIGNHLMKNKFIKESYISDVIQREVNSPTGLQFKNGCIAIPHSTPNGNVLRDTIGILVLNNNVIFENMLDKSELDTKIILFLALQDGKTHMKILSKIMDIFKEDYLIKMIEGCSSAEEVVNLLKEKVVIE